MIIKTLTTNIVKGLSMITQILEKPITTFPKPELVMGDRNTHRTAFLDKLAGCNSSVICIATRKETVKVANDKRTKKLVRCFNWIPLCGKDGHLALSLGHAVIYSSLWGEGSRFWLDMAAFFVAALFAHTSTLEYPTPAEAYKLISTLSAEGLTKILVNSPNDIARQYAELFITADVKVRENIIAGVSRRLFWLNNSNLRGFTSASLEPPDFNKLREQNISLCLDLTQENAKEILALTGLCCAVVFHQLKQNNHQKTVYFFIDDLSNVGYMQDLFLQVSLVRKHNLGLVFGVSSLQELEKLYGSNANIILDNSVITQEQMPLAQQ